MTNRRFFRIFALALLALAALAGVALAQTFSNPAAPCPGAPANTTCGDNYLDSKALNAPGSRLDTVQTIVDPVNTATATTQSAIVPGGQAEPTRCGTATPGASVPYGKTIWYEFYPHIHGVMRVRAETSAPGFDPVIAASRFDRRNNALVGAFQCINDSTATNQEAFFEVGRGSSNVVQVGGVNGAGGPTTMRLDFFADRDADGVLEAGDNPDRCPNLRGRRSLGGCPPTLSADPALASRATGGGKQIVSLRVAVTRGSTVEVTCSRRRCRRQVKRRVRRAASFPGLRGVTLPVGTDLVIRVTKRGAIGRWIRYRIRRGTANAKTERCLNPGSRKPRRRCR